MTVDHLLKQFPSLPSLTHVIDANAYSTMELQEFKVFGHVGITHRTKQSNLMTIIKLFGTPLKHSILGYTHGSTAKHMVEYINMCFRITMFMGVLIPLRNKDTTGSAPFNTVLGRLFAATICPAFAHALHHQRNPSQ
jgi:hypothetical protein